jgi:hypothetical protein
MWCVFFWGETQPVEEEGRLVVRRFCHAMHTEGCALESVCSRCAFPPVPPGDRAVPEADVAKLSPMCISYATTRLEACRLSTLSTVWDARGTGDLDPSLLQGRSVWPDSWQQYPALRSACSSCSGTQCQACICTSLTLCNAHSSSPPPSSLLEIVLCYYCERRSGAVTPLCVHPSLPRAPTVTLFRAWGPNTWVTLLPS